MADEGHFIAKTYIAQALENTDNWGINRDGTTRRKQKILNTSVTLDTGDVISLGFSRVAHTATSWENQQCGFRTGLTQTELYYHRR